MLFAYFITFYINPQIAFATFYELLVLSYSLRAYFTGKFYHHWRVREDERGWEKRLSDIKKRKRISKLDSISSIKVICVGRLTTIRLDFLVSREQEKKVSLLGIAIILQVNIL